MNRTEYIAIFVEELWTWFSTHRRSLPWRDLERMGDTPRAYRILVSEVMLQQTQVPRVITIFKRFLETFPTLQDLAKASNRNVLLAWRGMGYNSRALRLRDAARRIVEDFGGVFPRGMDELRSIKGIGHYTAAAIRNFAFGIPTPCIDTNIRRVLHRTFVGPENPDGTWRKDDRYLLGLAEEILERALSHEPTKNQKRKTKNLSADWHAALMDFGSLVQTKRNPKWDICPLTKRGICKASFRVGAPRWGAQKRKNIRKEPGRLVGSTFIPNRIFRGKIVEELRDTKRGLRLSEIGKRVCLDWKPVEHSSWLKEVLEKLERDTLIRRKEGVYVLAE